MASLELSGVTVERGGRPVVKDVSISVPAGQVTALLGPNGAGKSSLVLAVGGVVRPRPGSVSLDGLELSFAIRAVYVRGEPPRPGGGEFVTPFAGTG